MRILVIGGDGFCGWPTSLHLCRLGHDVMVVDNFARRLIDDKLGTVSLTEIADPAVREDAANRYGFNLKYTELDIASQPIELRELLRKFRPEAIVHFGEQRAAPYSMIDDETRRYTVDNNVSGTHNLLSAIVDIDREIHLVHLGTMGVYGYSDDFGTVPEGYLSVIPSNTGKRVDILYPPDPGSVYHMTKVLDQSMFYFYNKNWGIQITDLHQGIVWGVQTEDTKVAPELVNRFDYDGCYGTVLNRFMVQGVTGSPLTVYGTGGQTRAFIHISDTAKCIELAIANRPSAPRVRIFNQVAETKSVLELAALVSQRTGSGYQQLENPRKERAENDLEVENTGLSNLGFTPTKLANESLLEDLERIAESVKGRLDPKKILNSPRW